MEVLITFTDDERNQLTDSLLQLDTDPYRQPDQFAAEIRGLSERIVPERHRSAVGGLRIHPWASDPVVRVTNCPMDPALPRLDPAEPVVCKYQTKATHVAEGFLSLWCEWTGTEIIGHRSVNDGDRYHDIFPKQSMYDTQSQKTIGTLRFHRDFTNHYVSPDFVNTLVLRDAGANIVLSTFTFNVDVLSALDRSTVRVLRSPRFFTPFDDISVRESNVITRDAQIHAVVEGERGLRVFEGRTVGLDPDASAALDRVIELLHTHKRSFRPGVGELVAFANDAVIHGREVVSLVDPGAMSQRWLMKTHNVWSLQAHEKHFEPEAFGVVRG